MTSSALHCHRERGFTLIELLVVLIIVGVLAAIAVPSFLAQKSNASGTKVKQNILTIRKAIEACAAQNGDGSFTGCAEHGPVWKFDPALAKLPRQDSGGPFTESGEGKYDINGVQADGTVVYAPAATEVLHGFEVNAYAQDGDATIRFSFRSLPDGTVVRSCTISPSGTKSRMCAPSRTW